MTPAPTDPSAPALRSRLAGARATAGIGAVLLLGALWATPPVAAQSREAAAATTPDTAAMIEALRPASAGTRNLVLRARPEAAASVIPGTEASASATAPTPPTANAPPVAVAADAPTPATDAPGLSLAVLFESNSAQVRPESGPVLGRLVAALQSPDLKSLRFAIEGHTDAVGSPAANQSLSQARAEEVRLYLVALGVHPSRLKAVGRGSSDLVNPRQPNAPENRRVRVVPLP